MATTQTSKSAALRARLSHPVIDSDGHTVEFEPAVLDYLKEVGGTKIVERYLTQQNSGWASWYNLSWAERRDRRATRAPWWGLQSLR